MPVGTLLAALCARAMTEAMGIARRARLRRARSLLIGDSARPAAHPGFIGNTFAILDLLIVLVMTLAVAVLWVGLALLSMIGAGASWHADLFGLLFTPPFLVLELTAIGAATAAVAHINCWRIRWFLQAFAFLPAVVTVLWLAGELRWYERVFGAR